MTIQDAENANRREPKARTSSCASIGTYTVYILMNTIEQDLYHIWFELDLENKGTNLEMPGACYDN